MKDRFLKIFVLASLISLLACVGGVSSAPDYPNRPIEVIVPYPPGGVAEIVVRPYKEHLQKVLGQPVVFVFKPGAGGAVGTAYVSQARPDGYTILSGSTSPLVLLPLTSKKGLGYTPEDFTYICNLTVNPQVWLVKEDSPYKTMKDFDGSR